MYSFVLAIGTQTEKLKYMVVHRKAGIRGNLAGQLIQLVALESDRFSTRSAHEQMFVSVILAHDGVAAICMMYALDEVKRFELFKCPVHGNQSHPGVSFAADGEQICRFERTLRTSQLFDNNAPWSCDAVSTGLKAFEPMPGKRLSLHVFLFVN